MTVWKIAIGTTAFVLMLAAASAAHAGWDKARDNAADSLLGGIVSPTTVPSVAACIAIDGAPVFQKSFGMMSPGKGATPKTIYRIGSLSKQFTAAAILALIEDGAKVPKDGSPFGLDNNVSLFFDGVGGWSKPGAPMTVRRLATMTSYLPDYTQMTLPGLDATQPVKDADLTKALLALQPGAKTLAYSYSSTNYFLLAKIIDQVAPTLPVRVQVGTPPLIKPDYRAYIRKRLFKRAGLTQTNFIDDAKPLGEMATPTVAPGAAFANMAWPKGAGAIQSNVVDLCKWDAALVSAKVLTQASGVTMGTPLAPMLGRPPGSYAMGWAVTHFPAALEFSHGGNIPGYTAVNLIAYYGGTHSVAVVILTNGDQVQNLLGNARTLAQSAMNP